MSDVLELMKIVMKSMQTAALCTASCLTCRVITAYLQPAFHSTWPVPGLTYQDLLCAFLAQPSTKTYKASAAFVPYFVLRCQVVKNMFFTKFK
jgi:hypothetical protein